MEECIVMMSVIPCGQRTSESGTDIDRAREAALQRGMIATPLAAVQKQMFLTDSHREEISTQKLNVQTTAEHISSQPVTFSDFAELRNQYVQCQMFTDGASVQPQVAVRSKSFDDLAKRSPLKSGKNKEGTGLRRQSSETTLITRVSSEEQDVIFVDDQEIVVTVIRRGNS